MSTSSRSTGPTAGETLDGVLNAALGESECIELLREWKETDDLALKSQIKKDFESKVESYVRQTQKVPEIRYVELHKGNDEARGDYVQVMYWWAINYWSKPSIYFGGKGTGVST
jgi:hypothetical protein